MAARPPGAPPPLAAPAQANADAWMRGAEAELDVAKQLDNIGQPARSVMFHAGQAVEFALKAIFMKVHNHAVWPPVDHGAAWHSIEHLGRVTGVEADFRGLIASRPYLVANWLTVRDWDHRARFPDMHVSRDASKRLLRAVNHHQDGVMVWLRSRYRRS